MAATDHDFARALERRPYFWKPTFYRQDTARPTVMPISAAKLVDIGLTASMFVDDGIHNSRVKA